MMNDLKLDKICPEKFCFLWHEKGIYIAKGVCLNLEDSFQDLEYVDNSHCGCPFGICKRNKDCNDTNAKDFYEPNEIELRKLGLSWFYYMDSNHLNNEDKKKYNDYFKNLERK